MPRGYRLAIIALGLTLAGTALGQENAEEGQPIPVERPADQGEYTEETSDADDAAADPIYRVLVVRDEGEAVAAEDQQRIENERADQDLDAQSRMAIAADDIVFLTRLQIALAVLGTVAVLWSLRLARISNEAAIESVRVARNADRPYISPIVPTVSGWKAVVTGTYNLVQIHLNPRNIGKGVGFIHSIGFAHEICFEGEQGGKPLTITDDFGRVPVSPDSELTDFGPNAAFPIPDHERDRLISHDRTLYIYGYIRYFDVFGVFRRTGFMFELVPVSFDPEDSPFAMCPHTYWYDEEEREEKPKPSRLSRLIAAWRDRA